MIPHVLRCLLVYLRATCENTFHEFTSSKETKGIRAIGDAYHIVQICPQHAKGSNYIHNTIQAVWHWLFPFYIQHVPYTVNHLSWQDLSAIP